MQNKADSGLTEDGRRVTDACRQALVEHTQAGDPGWLVRNTTWQGDAERMRNPKT